MRPPTVSIDEEGAEVLSVEMPQNRIEWSRIREFAIQVTVFPDLGYSEAFWQLAGDGINFGVPVELVAGAEAFIARLFEFSGFDQAEYQRVRQAEASGCPGRFICWHADGADPDSLNFPTSTNGLGVDVPS